MMEFPAKSPAWFDHAQDRRYQRLSGDAILSLDEIGVWAETILDERNEYENFLYKLASEGKLGWSSGTASHLVVREPVGETHRVNRWPLGLDASLTHRPAEPRNVVTPLKSVGDNESSIFDSLKDEPETEEVASEGRTNETSNNITHENVEEIKMTDEVKEVQEEKTFVDQDQVQQMLQDAVRLGVEEAMKKLPAKEEPKNIVEVVKDEADKPFKSLAEQCAAVKAFVVSQGNRVDPRLSRLNTKQTGAEEGIPSEGGFLVEPTLTAEILKPLHEEGPFSRFARRLPVGGNSNYGWINGVDETSRATGSRWGGIRGYRLAEGASITASQPKFRRINWELKKFAVLVYGTDELLADASMFSEVVRTGAAEELMFMVNDDILNGLGTGGPLGILQSPALISVGAETGQAAATIVYENLVKMWSRLDARSKANAAWFINTDTNPQLDAIGLAVGTGALEPRFISYGDDGVMRIKGKPVYETEFNATLGTQGDIMLANMQEYLYWEKGGLQAASSIHVQFTTDETVFRFIYRVDGKPSIASPLTPYKGTNTVGPFVVLDTRS